MLLPPEIIEKIKKERREREDNQRPVAELPLNQPEIRQPHQPIEQEEKTDRVVVIDLA